mmetsp:Transcript_18397/g.25586  ORF Transcript_18397/g.25586 Transcript_18397/m.25586 type:complete len:314 (+) Transcript_18397:3-944(+)
MASKPPPASSGDDGGGGGGSGLDRVDLAKEYQVTLGNSLSSDKNYADQSVLYGLRYRFVPQSVKAYKEGKVSIEQVGAATVHLTQPKDNQEDLIFGGKYVANERAEFFLIFNGNGFTLEKIQGSVKDLSVRKHGKRKSFSRNRDSQSEKKMSRPAGAQASKLSNLSSVAPAFRTSSSLTSLNRTAKPFEPAEASLLSSRLSSATTPVSGVEKPSEPKPKKPRTATRLPSTQEEKEHAVHNTNERIRNFRVAADRNSSKSVVQLNDGDQGWRHNQPEGDERKKTRSEPINDASLFAEEAPPISSSSSSEEDEDE